MSTATLFPLPVEQAAVEFFYEHAGFSYDPKKETATEGHLRGAQGLAEAEAYAKAHGWYVGWVDDYDSRDADRDTEWADWPHYHCELRDAGGHHLASLGGIMFAEKGDWLDGDPYARVVEAELFAEAMHDHLARLEREASR